MTTYSHGSIGAIGCRLTLHAKIDLVDEESMSEPEIKPFVPLVFGCGQIRRLLLSRHATPYFLSSSVNGDIEEFGSPEHTNVVRDQTQQHLVAGEVVRGVVCSIDLSFHQYLLSSNKFISVRTHVRADDV